ncbi:MAG: hypothetical protein EKK46_09980, partial [Rhodocyclaceae bacterium]
MSSLHGLDDADLWSIIDERELQQRKDYLGLSDEDVACLRALQSEAATVKESYLDRFYQELEGIAETREVLSRATVSRERLRQMHGDQLLLLLGGQYDLDYARGRMRIGVTHQRVGLKPE